MLETIVLIIYSVGLVGIGMIWGYDLRKFMENEKHEKS